MEASTLDTQREISWYSLDKQKFISYGALIYGTSVGALYPLSVLKIRMQISKETGAKHFIPVVKRLIRVHGIRGFYRGFPTAIACAIPSRAVYLSTLESVKFHASNQLEAYELPEIIKVAIANGAGGMAAAYASQAISVPADMVTQKMILKHGNRTSSLGVARHILETDGARGFYRGFLISVRTYSLTNTIWWGTYGASQRLLSRYIAEDDIVIRQALGGFSACAAASLVTTPVDTVKTRMQVLTDKTARQVAAELLANGGFKALYKGLGPRFLGMSALGTSCILSYEYLKRLCMTRETADTDKT